METNIRIIINVLYAIRSSGDKATKRNIILANASDETIMSVIRYELGTPQLGFPEKDVLKPAFYIAEPPHIYSWLELMEYITTHSDVDDKRATVRKFIRLKPKGERQMWADILSKAITLGDRKYLRAELRKLEYQKPKNISERY